MNEEFFEILIKNILYIEDIETSDIKSGIFDVKEYVDKYSSRKKMSLRLFLNGELVSTSKYFIVYKCDVCKNNKRILLKRFLTKKSSICKNCMNRDETKTKKQSDTWKRGILPKRIKIIKNNIDLIKESNIEFNKETDDFKKRYYETHLTHVEFEDLRHQIFSVDGVLINDNMILMEHIRINNQMLYSQFLYDNKNDILISMRNIKMICENCDKIYNITRKLKEKAIFKKSLCKKCYLSNRVFKIRNVLNIKNEKVIYQTRNELKLIYFCNDNNILIENGPVLQYFYNNRYKKYYVDFYIPQYKLLIEIKDYHIWHKNEISSGVWELKEKCAKKYAKEHNLEYRIIFNQDFNGFIDTFKI